MHFTWHGWDIQWEQWREPYNQLVTIGFWRASQGDAQWVATTGGLCRRYREAEALDVTHSKDWPVLVRPDEGRKERARQLLLECLRQQKATP